MRKIDEIKDKAIEAGFRDIMDNDVSYAILYNLNGKRPLDSYRLARDMDMCSPQTLSTRAKDYSESPKAKWIVREMEGDVVSMINDYIKANPQFFPNLVKPIAGSAANGNTDNPEGANKITEEDALQLVGELLQRIKTDIEVSGVSPDKDSVATLQKLVTLYFDKLHPKNDDFDCIVMAHDKFNDVCPYCGREIYVDKSGKDEK